MLISAGSVTARSESESLMLGKGDSAKNCTGGSAARQQLYLETQDLGKYDWMSAFAALHLCANGTGNMIELRGRGRSMTVLRLPVMHSKLILTCPVAAGQNERRRMSCQQKEARGVMLTWMAVTPCRSSSIMPLTRAGVPFTEADAPMTCDKQCVD